MNKRVVVIGGGTGTFTILSGLKQYPLELAAAVSMADSGGSTGKLRDQLGVLPPGDVRQALVALSESDKIMRDLFNYRFEEGDLKGHSVGNLLISGLEKITGDFETAILYAGQILRIDGKVLPITTTKTNLHATYDDGKVVESETLIDEPEDSSKRHIVEISLKPEPQITHNAELNILHADMIVFGPGDLYTSQGQCLVVPGVAEAIQRSGAVKVYNTNLMTKMGQTHDMTAKDHVEVLENWIGKDQLDYVLVNSAPLPKKELSLYEKYGESVVEDDFDGSETYTVVRDDFLAASIAPKQKGDTLTRSLIRHDSDKIAKKLYEILQAGN